MGVKFQYVLERITHNVADNVKAIREVSDDQTNFECDGLVLLL
jgi:hypothetical protein